MDIFVLIPLLSASLGALIPLFKELVVRLIKTEKGEKFFRESPVGKAILKGLKLERSVSGPEVLFKELSVASQKMDEVVRQIQEYTHGREQAVAKLESELGMLSQQELELKQRIQGLQNVPLAAAEYFAQLVHKGERRSALRDYVLFLVGVVVTTGVEIVLRKLGWV